MWVEVKHRLTLLILISSCFCVYRFPSVPFSNNTFETFCLYGLELNIIYIYVTINRFNHLFNTSFLPFSVCGSQLLLKMEIFKNTLLTSPKNNFANVTKNRRDSFISWGLFSAADGSTFCFSGGFFLQQQDGVRQNKTVCVHDNEATRHPVRQRDSSVHLFLKNSS